MEFGKPHWRTYEQGIQREWLLTNGIGGYASSTVIGANTRRYHGLLIAALQPPVMRQLVLSRIDETVVIGEGEAGYCFNTCETPQGICEGYKYLERVIIDPLPSFVYRVEDVFIDKKVCMVSGENTVLVVYRITNGSNHIRLKLTPLVNFRDHHENSNKAGLKFNVECQGGKISIMPSGSQTNISIYCSEGRFAEDKDKFFQNMEYAVEKERGLFALDDHYIPGSFEICIKPGEEKYVTIIASVEDEIKCVDGPELISKEEERVKRLMDTAGYNDGFARELVAAADKFIVYRQSTGTKTVIAGYPWFTDWGRDTMIAFSGLTLCTGRFDDAKEILYTFSKYVRNGLIPNMFPDEGQEPVYNTVDASLWYFEAVSKYLEYTRDYQFIKDNVYDVLKQIIKGYMQGTDYSIRMDSDYLISAGEKGSQLTWMDVKVGDWVPTPRHGKAVEISALWYNALKIMAHLAAKFGEDSLYYEDTAQRVRESFVENFWNGEQQCLYDVITDGVKIDKIRPNQIFSVSVSYPVIEGDMAKKVIGKVWRELYTSYGLRSLSPDDREYIGTYHGDVYKRDGAYHQGTVWAWPLGHFITAFMRVYGHTDENRRKAMRFIEPFKDHLMDGCVGSISEIFDGNEPLIPRGCFAQAWSVSEVLRAYVEDICI